MSIWEKLVGKKEDTLTDIEDAIALAKEQLEQLLGRIRAVEGSSPYNQAGVEKLLKQSRGLQDKIKMLEEKKRLAEERAVAGFK